LTSVLRALAIYSSVSFERGAGAETGTETGAKTIGAGAGIKVKVRVIINIKIKVIKNILKDGFSLRLLTRRVTAKKPRIKYRTVYIILLIRVPLPA
jgi:hypothetical protein